MAGDEADLVADLETVGGARDAEPSMLVGGALGGGGGFVADERGTRVEGERLEAGIDDRGPRPGGSSPPRNRRARLEGLGRDAVAVEVAAVIGGEVLNVRFRTSVDIPSAAPLNPAATLRRPFAGIVLAFPVSRVEDLPEPSSSNHGNRPLCLTHAGRIGSLLRNTRMDER
jgi:hypothetical protein